MLSTQAKHIFQNLEGTWAFSRIIKDRLALAEHYAVGEAVFLKEGNKNPVILLYHEKGKVNLSDLEKELGFERKYIFKLKNDEIHIIFNDGISKGKLYQKLIPEGDSSGRYIGTEHLCVRDNYEGRYAFPNDQEFSILYFIKGPKKNMEIETRFEKQFRDK